MSVSYNSDREGHAKHKWIVQKALPGDTSTALETPAGTLKYDRYGRFVVKDEGLASEIRSEHYMGDVVVSRMRTQVADSGHNYFWGGWPKMPWKKDEDAV